MKIICLTICFVIAVTEATEQTFSQLDWEQVTAENFTPEHNWELIKNHVGSSYEEMLKTFNKPTSRGIMAHQVEFRLYTRNGPEEGVVVSVNDDDALSKGKFDNTKKSLFATHGFLSSAEEKWVQSLKTAHLSANDVNFFTIDWSYCASSINYLSVTYCTAPVGQYLAHLIKYLGEKGADISDMHLMGHSLGAHAVASVSTGGVMVGRITGFDPAGPLYYLAYLTSRIDPGDAIEVDIIHTDCSVLGFNGILGNYDFFANGCGKQPGCIKMDPICDHSMSHDYYIDTIYNNYKYPATQCDSKDDAKSGRCSGTVNYMGFLSPSGSEGIYYLNVNEAPTNYTI